MNGLENKNLAAYELKLALRSLIKIMETEKRLTQKQLQAIENAKGILNKWSDINDVLR